MLWLVGLLLAAAWGVLWWRFGAASNSAVHAAPPVLAGNHPSLATRHYRLADFRPVPLAAVKPSADAEAVPAATAEIATPPTADAPPAPPVVEAEAPAGGELPAGATHNYLTAPAPTANDEHNRGVEMTAAQRRAKMRELMSQAAEKRQPVA